MTLIEVKARVAAIFGAAGDPERAHGLEDELYLDVLRAIATGRCLDYPPEDFAEEALRASAVSFPRYRS
jgi:hypothetical protein